MNRFGIKNFYGAFLPPDAVVIDPEFLKTLPDREWISGTSEAFKVALIKDAEFFEFLEENGSKIASRDMASMEHLVQRSAEIHMDHIGSGGDPFERGSSRPLDFGHWSAHRLEEMTNYELRHGEAVAIGIAIDLFCAEELGHISTAERKRALDAMEKTSLPLRHDALREPGRDGLPLEVITGLESFRQHLGGNLTLAMPHSIGKMTFIHTISNDTIVRAIDSLKERNSS